MSKIRLVLVSKLSNGNKTAPILQNILRNLKTCLILLKINVGFF